MTSKAERELDRLAAELERLLTELSRQAAMIQAGEDDDDGDP